jgi:hypothetical protein
MNALTMSAFAVMASVGFGASISVSPTHFEFEGLPGQTVSQKLTVFNSENLARRVKLYTGDFWYDKVGNRVFPDAGASPFSAASWVDLKTKEIEVAGKSSADVEFSFSIPPNAPSSGYASIFVEQAGDILAKHGSVGISLRVAVPLLYGKPAGPLKKISIDSFRVTKPTAFKPLVLRFLVRNDEDRYVFPEGSVLVLKGEKKELVAKGEVKRDRVVLPLQKVLFELPLSVEPKPGKYEGVLTLRYGDESHFVKPFSFQIP